MGYYQPRCPHKSDVRPMIRMSEAAFKGLQQEERTAKPRRKGRATDVLAERYVAQQITDFCRAHGFLVLRLQSGLFSRPGSNSRIRIGETGLPDYLVIRKQWSTGRGFCRAAFIEIKAHGKRLRPEQQEWFDEHRHQGFVCEVFDSLADFVAFYERTLA